MDSPIGKLRTHQEPKLQEHHSGRHASLNHANQTPRKYVKRYKVGTGFAFIQDSDQKYFKTHCTYKKFLSNLLSKFNPDQMVAFRWVPNRIKRAEKLSKQTCLKLECINSCVQPGCICIKGWCQ